MSLIHPHPLVHFECRHAFLFNLKLSLPEERPQEIESYHQQYGLMYSDELS